MDGLGRQEMDCFWFPALCITSKLYCCNLNNHLSSFWFLFGQSEIKRYCDVASVRTVYFYEAYDIVRRGGRTAVKPRKVTSL